MLTDTDATDGSPNPASFPFEGFVQVGNRHHFVNGGREPFPQDARLRDKAGLPKRHVAPELRTGPR